LAHRIANDLLRCDEGGAAAEIAEHAGYSSVSTFSASCCSAFRPVTAQRGTCGITAAI
jgi:AraC-like DNA-binding protein